MAQDFAPEAPRNNVPFVDPQSGLLTPAALDMLQQLWRQVVAGFVIVPCRATGKNTITLSPLLHQEGKSSYGNHMAFSFAAAQTSDGNVTLGVGSLGALKAYKTNGAAQATTGDVVAGSLYVAMYLSSLDSGAGGFVLK